MPLKYQDYPVCTYCPMSVMSLMSVLFFVSIMVLITEIHGVHVGLDECDAPGVHDDLTIKMSAVSMIP